MDEYKILSGDEVVIKGGVKAPLPEIGLKDVTPTGSWLEQKQIQSALEARKHLIEVQRIEKSGILTHAEWREDLKLAEITQQAGGYWQFLGHCKDNKLYLRPEEALFLMEVNCLLLRYNEVIVSLQQAYSLLLSDETSIFQYKVYASLSRLGYKVFKHIVKPSSKDNKPTAQNISCEQNKEENLKSIISEEYVSENNSNKVKRNMSVDVKHIQNVALEINVDKKECNIKNKCSEENEMTVEDCNLTSNKVIEESNADSGILNEENSACKEDVQEINKTNSKQVEENKEIETVKENITSDKNSLSEQNPMDIDQNSFIEVKDNFTETSHEAISQNTVDGQFPDNILSVKLPCEGTNTISSMVIDSDKITSKCSNSLQGNVEPERIEQTPRRGLDQGSSNIDPLTKYCQWKLEKLKNRQSKCPRNLEIHNCFKNCPDILENQVITVITPKDEYLPKNIFLNKLSYVINVANITSKNVSMSPHSTYSLSDEVNGAHVRRVTNVPALPAPLSNIRSPLLSHPNTSFPPFFPGLRPNMPFRHYNIWRPRPPNMNYFQFNLFFQRPYMANFNPRFQFYPRMHTPIFPRHCSDQNNFTTSNEFRDLPNRSRKRPKDSAKIIHLENITNLASRIKVLSPLNSLRCQNINAIQNLIQTYNMRFSTRLRLSQEFDIVDDTIVDTITLDDDDEEHRTKKPRLDGQADLFMENLNKIRQTALRLKKLENKNKATARHRRALSSVIKTFNKYFKADIHMTDNYEVLDRRHIDLDSSSDSDCVVEEVPKVTAGKKLRNPFNILKKLAEKQLSPSSPTTSRQDISESLLMQNSQEVVRESFKQGWLPNENDFGRPELVSRDTMTARFIETKKEELLFDFLKNQTYKFNNWIDLKIAFLESVEETNAIFQSEAMIENNVDIKSLVTSEDCSNMAAVLKKLAVINSNKNVKDKSPLTIDYDVYNRDVKQFRKSNRPKPHFRVLCIEESSSFPSGIDIASLHATIEDDVPTVFAVVGINSISYVQLNPTELRVYIPCKEMG